MFYFFGLLIACGDSSTNIKNEGDTSTEPTGAISVTPQNFVFTDIVSEVAQSDTLRIESTGDNPLIVDRVDITNSGGGIFTLEVTDDFTLNSGDSKELTLVATAEQTLTAPQIGELRIVSNDADNPTLLIAICATSSSDGCE